jgi:Flp pilus assembly protein protease CpaA
MLIESILLGTALLGSILAGIIDLKTTEIPDWIPYSMMVIGVVGNLFKSYLLWSYLPILLSLVVGLLFLGFGFILYYSGQWGGGDAKILSGIGFLLPQFSGTYVFFPFPVSYLFNVFFVGAIYMIGYILVMSLINRKVLFHFINDFKASIRQLFFLNIGIIVFLIIFSFYMVGYLQFVTVNEMFLFGGLVLGMTIGMFTLWRFAKTAEEIGFKRKIKVSDLREGDVPDDSKLWEGLTKKQVENIQKSGKKYIVIKEGVRFAPAFPIALLVSVLVGDMIFWFIGLVN